MKKFIQITAIFLEFLGKILKKPASFSFLINKLEEKYPEEVKNREDVIYTKKELQERNAGTNKNPIFIKILLVIPATFAILVVLLGLYVGYLFLTGKM